MNRPTYCNVCEQDTDRNGRCACHAKSLRRTPSRWRGGTDDREHRLPRRPEVIDHYRR